MPQLYIITGSNGAGKSTVGPMYLPKHIQKRCEVFDGDKLYMHRQRELWSQGIRAHKEAKKMALSYVEETFDNLVAEALKNHSDFAYEGHFTNDATWSIPARFKKGGYIVNMIFLGLESVRLSKFRVADRSKQGGHYVPPPVVEDNFFGNLEKLNRHYQILDGLKIIDTSEAKHRTLIDIANSIVIFKCRLDELPDWFSTHLKNLVAIMQQA
jgi:predicted ABC-type ATPase